MHIKVYVSDYYFGRGYNTLENKNSSAWINFRENEMKKEKNCFGRKGIIL